VVVPGGIGCIRSIIGNQMTIWCGCISRVGKQAATFRVARLWQTDYRRGGRDYPATWALGN